MKGPLRFICSLAVIALLSAGCRTAGPDNSIRVELTRKDGITGFSGYQFEFGEDVIAKELEKTPTRFPDPLPPDARKVMFIIGRVMGFIQPMPNGPGVLLTLDVNANHDLTDDPPFEVPEVDSARNGAVMKLVRSYTSPAPHTEWLPYKIAYEKSRGLDGKLREDLFVVPDYRYEGQLDLGGKVYDVSLYDGDLGGRFIREKQLNVSLAITPKDPGGKPGAGSAHRLFELIPIGGSLYEIKAIAEDGSWIELATSGLPETALGKKAPDMVLKDTQGRSFQIKDYRGQVLVLDFWFAGCKPCIAKFPAIKKMIESFADKPLATVGVSIDKPERVEQAKKIVADHRLGWRQVIEGRGEFLPVYQVYGRLPEHPMTFPIYVAIDESGTTRYATNDFEKMGQFLEAHFRDPRGPDNFLFIPLRPAYDLEKKEPPITAVDFGSAEAQALADGTKLRLPADMPRGARVGRLPNGIALMVSPGRTSDKVRLVLDADGNSDLTNDEPCDIPVLDAPVPDESLMTRADCRIFWKSGAIGFGGFPFFARPSGDVYFKGDLSKWAGSFFEGRDEYRLELTDPNGDRVVTKEDWRVPGFLRLKVKKDGFWVDIHEGTSLIPIGRSLYKVRDISDDGYLAVLEKEN